MGKLVKLGGSRGPGRLDEAKAGVVSQINGVHQEFPPGALLVAKYVYGEGVEKLVGKAYEKRVVLTCEMQSLIDRWAPAKVYRRVTRAQKVGLTLAKPGTLLHQHTAPYPLEECRDVGPRLSRCAIRR